MSYKHFLCVAFAVALPAGASAQTLASGFVAGPKLGIIDIDERSLEAELAASGFDSSVDTGNGLGFTLGWQFNPNWSLEFEYLQADIDVAVRGFGTVNFDYTTKALYGVYRSDGQVYFLGKLGMLNEELEADGFSDDESGLSLGLGGGFRVNENFSLEAEYVLLSDEINYYGVTGRFKF